MGGANPSEFVHSMQLASESEDIYLRLSAQQARRRLGCGVFPNSRSHALNNSPLSAACYGTNYQN